MSFRVKTILLLILLSLAPYVISMLYLGNAYRADLEKQTRDNMRYQLGIMADRLDSSLQSLEKDMMFIASLDIMNDIITGDIDRRIYNLLLLKKEDLHLIGNFEVTDNSLKVIASTNFDHIGKKRISAGLISVPIQSTFDQKKIGELHVDYDLDNLKRYFVNENYLVYSLRKSGDRQPGNNNDESVLRVEKKLKQRPDLNVVLEQDRKYAFSILDSFLSSFYVALVIGILLIGTIAYVIASYIVNPILLLSSTARSITRTQDYSQRVSVERTDEIGSLASAFNLMISGMQRLIDQLREESENRIKLAAEKNRAEMLQDLSTKLSKYLSPQIYDSIFSGEKDVTLTSSRKKLTVFLSDIVNFTDITEQMESEDLTQLLNQYLSEMTEIALEFGATVDKYIGDAIMIFFGDPTTRGIAEDAKTCIRMAIKMQSRVSELHKEWRKSGYTKPFTIRIGIHTGFCTVGNFGTENRMDYTIVGSPVNVASRIESLAEPGAVYISEDTYLLVKDEIQCIQVSTATPKGLSRPVQLYKVMLDNEQSEQILIEKPGFQLICDPEHLTDENKNQIRKILADLTSRLR